MPSEFTLTQIIDQLQTQWSDAPVGTKRRWMDDSVNYAIPDVAPDDSGFGESAGFLTGRMTETNRLYARESFELWDDLIDIDLNEVARPGGSMITLAYSSTTLGGNGYARAELNDDTTPYTIVAQRIWLPPNWTNDEDADFVDLDGPLLLARDRSPALRYDGSLVSPPEPALWG